MAKKGALDAAPEDDKEDIGEDLIFAGANEHEHDEDESADRGDDPTAEQAAAAEEAEDEDEAEPVTKAKAKDEDEGEPAVEAAAEDESEDEDEDEDEEPAEVSNYVSKDRFNALNERMKLAEQALRDKEAELAKEAPEPVAAFDYDAKEMAYMELVTDGEFEKAKAIRQEIRAAERAELQAEADAKNSNSSARVSEQIAFNNKVQELNEEFDQFNPEHDDYDQVLVDEAVDRRDLFVARGLSPAAALAKAGAEVAKLYDLKSNFEVAAEKELERLAAEDKGKAPAKKKLEIEKKVALAGKQPPKMEEGSAQEEQKGATSMSDAEFDALPEATKARMRGDIL